MYICIYICIYLGSPYRESLYNGHPLTKNPYIMGPHTKNVATQSIGLNRVSPPTLLLQKHNFPGGEATATKSCHHRCRGQTFEFPVAFKSFFARICLWEPAPRLQQPRTNCPTSPVRHNHESTRPACAAKMPSVPTNLLAVCTQIGCPPTSGQSTWDVKVHNGAVHRQRWTRWTQYQSARWIMSPPDGLITKAHFSIHRHK